MSTTTTVSTITRARITQLRGRLEHLRQQADAALMKEQASTTARERERHASKQRLLDEQIVGVSTTLWTIDPQAHQYVDPCYVSIPGQQPW